LISERNFPAASTSHERSSMAGQISTDRRGMINTEDDLQADGHVFYGDLHLKVC
jgi:hypothetical protein